MTGILRRTRAKLVSNGKAAHYLKYAVGEIFLVVIGILIAVQINSWQEARKAVEQEQSILQRLAADIASDRELMDYQISKGEDFIRQYRICLEILLGDREPSLRVFRENLRSIKTIISFNYNRTTFDNIIATGQIEVIRSQALSEALTRYYAGGAEGWDSAMREYARKIIAPFFLNFDHVPQPPQTSARQDAPLPFTHIDVSGSPIEPRTLDDYRSNIFVLNVLRERIYLIEGQLMEYRRLRESMDRLALQIRDALAG